jgi:hypothetical protein
VLKEQQNGHKKIILNEKLLFLHSQMLKLLNQVTENSINSS